MNIAGMPPKCRRIKRPTPLISNYGLTLSIDGARRIGNVSPILRNGCSIGRIFVRINTRIGISCQEKDPISVYNSRKEIFLTK